MSSPSTQMHHWLGFEEVESDGSPVYKLSFKEHHIGNPAIRALHGGVVASFLDCITIAELRRTVGDNVRLETINTDVDFLRSTTAADMFGSAKLLRAGRRIAFVEAYGWQESPEKIAATGRARIRIIDPAD